MTSVAVAADPCDANLPMPRGKLAMWLFLASEVMFFAGLLGSYIVLRMGDPVAFDPDFLKKNYSELKVWLAAINTAVLICSSFTMVLAVYGAKEKNKAKVKWSLFATAGLGILFCILKGIEYKGKYDHGVWLDTENVFYSCYFVITGVHLIHVIGGIIPFIVMGFMSDRWVKDGNITVELWGLYWHFVDIVWIFLFPLLYLLK